MLDIALNQQTETHNYKKKTIIRPLEYTWWAARYGWHLTILKSSSEGIDQDVEQDVEQDVDQDVDQDIEQDVD